MNTLFNWGSLAIIVGGYVLGFYFQNRRIDDLRDTVNRRITDLSVHVDARFADMKDFIKSEILRLESRIERLEHPVARA